MRLSGASFMEWKERSKPLVPELLFPAEVGVQTDYRILYSVRPVPDFVFGDAILRAHCASNERGAARAISSMLLAWRLWLALCCCAWVLCSALLFSSIFGLPSVNRKKGFRRIS